MTRWDHIEVLLDIPTLASVVRLYWDDGTETVEVVLAEGVQQNAEVIDSATAVIPEGFYLAVVEYDLDDTPLGVRGSMRTYKQKGAQRAA